MDLHARRLITRCAFVACALLWSSTGAAQIFSPGALSKAHASIDGLKNCLKCHEPGNRLANARCVDCHKEIGTRVDAGKGFHGRLGDQSCASCHREHKGENAKLISWGAAGRKAFDHGRTGYPLKGAHRPLECKDCHERRRIDDESVLALIKKTGRDDTHLGLSTKCRSCHFDEHRGQLDPRCDRCHVEDAFKPARRFNHNRMSAFKLQGKHRRVACAKCHSSSTDEKTPTDMFPKPASSRVVRYSRIPHERCASCHEDTHHKGTMGNRCEKCHVPDGWDRLRGDAKDIGFHEKTRFPLRGEHIDVDCKACHGPFAGEHEPRWKDLPFERCTDCHMDAHLGTLADASGTSPDCKGCHTVERFMPASFGLEEHRLTRFELAGGHRAVDCRLCHIPLKAKEQTVPDTVVDDRRRRGRPVVTSDFRMDITSDLERCESCHRDPHDAQFPDVMQATGCRACHRDTRFTDLVFDHDRQSRFPLEGKHAKADCRQCHVPDDVVRYRGVAMLCASCHRDAHGGQFDQGQKPTDCATCHDAAAFKPSRFNHDDPSFTSFALKGRHRAIACERCHTPLAVEGGPDVTWYRGVPRTCAACHVDEHEGRFNEFTP